MINIEVKQLEIDWGWVRRELSEKERIPPLQEDGLKHVIHISVDESLERAKCLTEPKVASVVKRVVRLKSDSIEVEGATTFSGKRLSTYLNGVEKLHIFLVTLGSGIEGEASRFMSKGEPLYGYLLDRIGSLAVESLAESVEKNLREDYLSKGKSVSMRLSPGYCDWPIEEQFVLAKVLDFSKVGVYLTSRCMMVPRKSISAMVGIGPKGLFLKRISQCAACDRIDCDHRRSC